MMDMFVRTFPFFLFLMNINGSWCLAGRFTIPGFGVFYRIVLVTRVTESPVILQTDTDLSER